MRGRPRGVHAIHFADDAFGREAIDHDDVVGHTRRPEILQDGKLGCGFGRDAPPQQALPGLQQVEERTCAPARVGPALLARGELRVQGACRQASAAIFLHGGLRRIISPAHHAALIHRVQRIDEQQRAADRQAGGDGALAKSVHQRSFRLAAQARLGEPRVQSLDVVLGDHPDPGHWGEAVSPLRSEKCKGRSARSIVRRELAFLLCGN